MLNKPVQIQIRKQEANALLKQNRLEEAKAIYEKICKRVKRDPECWYMLGAINGRLGNYQKAVEYCSTAVKLDPANIPALYNLAIGLRDTNRLLESIKSFRRIIKLQPGYRDTESSLGHVLISLGRFEEAESVFQSALKLKQDDPEFYAAYGSAMQEMGRYEAALEAYKKALALHHREAHLVYDNMGHVLCLQGDHKGSLAAYEAALQLAPHDRRILSNVLLTLHYIPEITQQELLAQHRQWAIRAGVTMDSRWRGSHDADPDRRLRIGFVSSDLRRHSVTYFLEPVLAALNREHIGIWCYSAGQRPDRVTERLRLLSDGWHDIHDLKDNTVARRIVDDRIDILIDLNGHTAGSRLGVFTLKPAPLQMSWIGYPDTTGLPTIDYRITDGLSDPVGSEAGYVERLVRLPDCFLCYRGPDKAPDVSPLPALRNQYVTFGSFNNLAKINAQVIDLWISLLLRQPDAHLFLKNISFTDNHTRDRYLQMFLDRGIHADRIDLIGFIKSPSGHLGAYEHVDIALDTFPYNGTTTTCEAMWMGVPTITLTGKTHASRVGSSLLSAAGHPEWIAHTPEDYLDLAMELASDPEKLSTIRSGLRSSVQSSRLCDAAAFAFNFETVLRAAWREWCATRTK